MFTDVANKLLESSELTPVHVQVVTDQAARTHTQRLSATPYPPFTNGSSITTRDPLTCSPAIPLKSLTQHVNDPILSPALCSPGSLPSLGRPHTATDLNTNTDPAISTRRLNTTLVNLTESQVIWTTEIIKIRLEGVRVIARRILF